MSGTNATPLPVIELKPSEDEAPTMSRDLKRRIRQQEIRRLDPGTEFVVSVPRDQPL